MKKRIISTLLTVLMLISLISVFPVSVNAAGNISFVYSPAVLLGGETDYNIVWKTNVESIGYVTYKYNNQTYTVYDEKDGAIVSDEKIHAVRIPMEHLNAAQKYTATSAIVESRTGFNLKLGATVSKEGKVKWSGKTDNIKIGCFSDIHLYDTHSQGPLARSTYSLNNYMGGVDLILLPGDVTSIMTTESYLNLLLMAFEQFGADGTPILYVPGNHECRGITAQRLPSYFAFKETDDLYGRVKFGPIEFLVTFSGEDKIDEHKEYGDLNAMEHYKTEQYNWFYNCEGFSDEAVYRISLSHSQNLVDIYSTQDFMSRVKEYDPDIHINGHTHAQKIQYIKGYDFPFLHDGAHENNTTMRTTLVTITNGEYQIKGFTDAGSVAIEGKTPVKNYKKGASAQQTTAPQSETKQETEAPEIKPQTQPDKPTTTVTSVPTAAGVTTATLKGASDTTAIAVKPTVFDGGKYYNVVWQTTPDIDAAGEVVVTIGSNTYRYKDQIIGKIRTDSTHSVKIPKESLGSCKYEAKSRVVINYTFGGYVTSPPTSYGTYVSAGQISFKGEANAKQNKFTFLAVTGITTSTYAEKVKAEIGNKSPDMLVTLGNMVTSLDTEKEFGNYLKVTHTITGGKYPVMFIRGENETKGAFASHLWKYIRNTSDGAQGTFYLSSTYDKVNIIGLDTATAAPDSAEKFNGYANFDRIRQDQVSWLNKYGGKGLSNPYNIVFANADNLVDCAGANFTSQFGTIGVNVAVTGQAGKAILSTGSGTYSKLQVGSPEGDETYGVLITCKDEKINFEALGGEELGEIDVKESQAPENQPSENPDDVNKPGSDEDNQPSQGGEDNDPSQGGEDSPETEDPKDDDEDENEDDNPSSSEPTYIEGTFDGVDGEIYIREVEEGWYEDYVQLGFKATAPAPKANETTTEVQYINIIANLASINLYLYEGSDSGEKAAEWAEEYEIYSGYLGDNVVSDNIINTVLTAVFPAE